MGGAFYFAEDYAKAGKGPVYLFLNRYDAPHAAYPDRHYAGHCIDISTAFRLVAYLQMEEYSRNIAKRYAAFMRTGSPSLPDSDWPAFNLEDRPTMVYDRIFEVKADPVRRERELLDSVAGIHGVVDHYLGKGYKFPIKGKPSPELEY